MHRADLYHMHISSCKEVLLCMWKVDYHIEHLTGLYTRYTDSETWTQRACFYYLFTSQSFCPNLLKHVAAIKFSAGICTKA